MISAWKLRREARRIGRQILGVPLGVRDHLVMPAYHERVLRRRVRVSAGLLPEAERVAIFLVYPSMGLQPSHLRSLDYLASHGYAPLVVSNLPLQGEAREQVLRRCWTLLERPNFGHDFGGYREAVLWLAPRLGGLARLVVLNDSTWFPLPGGRDWLADAEALGTDLAGAVAQYGTPVYALDRLEEVEWRYDWGRRDVHYCSFALALAAPILRDPGFLDFWQRYRPRNRRDWTIHNGEIGFSQWVLRRGYSHAATTDVTRLHEELAALDDAALRRVVEQLFAYEAPLAKPMRREILSGAPPARDTIERFVLALVSKLGMGYTLTRYASERHGFPFLKKALVYLDADVARQALDYCAELPGEAGHEILAEAQALHRARLPHAA
jgi:hypothetical protein